MKQLKRVVLLTVLLFIVSMGVTISLKAAIGVGAWDAMGQSVSHLTGIKVGTIGMFFNSLCVLGQIVILRKKFKWIQLLQLPVNILLGTLINFFLYEVLAQLTIDSYIVNLLLLMGALVLTSLVVSAVMVLNVVTFAPEGLCMAISQVTNMEFPKIRQGMDILSVLVVLVLTVVFSLPLSLREGTIIGLLLFAPLMGFFMGKLHPIFKRLNLLEEEPIAEIKVEQKEQWKVIDPD